MRTKNAKRLWPVPATLAVMALAAFLAFGLMATNGAQPAEAQSDDADCTVNVTLPTADNADPAPTVMDDFDEDDSLHCQAKGDTAAVAFTGPAAPDTNVDDEAGKVEVLIQDDSGPIRAYINGQVEYDTGDSEYQITSAGTTAGLGTTGEEAPAPMRWRHMEVAIPLPERNAALQYEAQSTIIMVGGDVYIYTAGDALTSEIANAPDADKRNQLSQTDAFVNIRFLGDPALGKDGDDLNKKVDDDDMEQCVVGTDVTSDDVVAESSDCPGDTRRGTATWIDSTAVVDALESRSKLVVRTVVGENFTTTTPLISGKTVTHALTGTEEEIVIYALVEDAKSNALPETVVDFVADPVPGDIVAARYLSDDPETKTVIDTGTAGDDEILVDGLGTNDSPPVGGIIIPGDAVAAFPLDNLPNGASDSYIITVEVTVGSLSLGTVEIVRSGDPAELKAGVFNIDCFDMGEEDDYSDATFDDSKDDCDASGMAHRFGAGEMFVVKSHLEDARGIVVGAAGDMDIELADDFDNPIIDGDPVENNMPVEGKMMPMAWIYTVDEDAMLGDHMITVSTTAQNADDEDIDDVMLTVTVAGPPASLEISGDGNVDLGGSETFVVTARDAEGDIPHLTTSGPDQNDMVIVLIQPNTALVDGLNASNQVMLDPETGTAEFTVFAALDAEDGDHGRIIARLGDLQDIETITFGTVMGIPGMPMNVMAMADGHDMITVSWEAPTDTGNSDINGYMVQRAYMMADDMMSDWMDVDPAHMGMGTMYMDSGLMAETKYYYQVAAMNAQGMGAYSDGMAEGASATTEMMPNQAPMAGDAIADVMVYVGAMEMAQSTITDPDMDTLTWSAMSSADMYATVEVDDMGMVTITGVAAGVATITVTATDADGSGMSASQDIMVTVMMPNQAPMAGDAIADVMVYVGAMEMVQSTITDPDMDTLTWSAMSSNDMYATAAVDDMGMVTITGVAAGMATITVTATDPDGESASQDIMVTVAEPALGTAMGVAFGVNQGGALQVSWTKAANATGYIIIAVNDQ